MIDISEQIAAIEKEIRETPYHKGTEHHIGLLRARIARLKDKQQEGLGKKGGGGGGYAIKKQGDATIVLVGPPSCGKSTLINKLTNAESRVAPYEFTTVSVIPGMLKYKHAYIQILDVPGLIEGAHLGKGKGKEVLSVARGADLIVFMADYQRLNFFKKLVTELERTGIRINRAKPEIKIDKKLNGGVIVHTNIKQDFDKEMVRQVASEFGIKNAEITIKEKLTMDRLIDAFARNRVYIPAIYVINKSDLLTKPQKEKIDARMIQISAEKGIGLPKLKQVVWDKLQFILLYLVKADEMPSFDNPIVVKKGISLKEVGEKIGSEFVENKKSAKIWGKGAKFPGQEVSLSAKVEDGMQVRFI